tara:strand:+ start:696 stop:3146 length:2451 start_codon:yes stop_codon:yes gene_type:complete
MAIQSSSAVLKAYFETGDVPTSAQFGDLIDSTAYYDSSLEKLFLSGSGTGSIPYVSAKSINPYTGSSTINVSASLIPPYTAAGSGSNLGSEFNPWKTVYAISASIDHLSKHTGSAAITVSGGLNPSVASTFDLGAPSVKWNQLHVSGINADYISSSIEPDQTNLRDLGSSTRQFSTIFAKSASLEYISGSNGSLGTTIQIAKINQVSGALLPFADNVFDLGSSAKSWKDLHVEGTATIGTLALGNVGTIVVTTASLAIISSSRIDGVGGYGNIIISGGLVPGTTNVFDLGTTVKKWKTLHVSGASIDFVSSSLIPDQDNLRDLGSSAREWKNLYLDGTANIDTLSADAATILVGTVNTLSATTASLTIISSSRIDGVGGYGDIIISGGLVPGTTDVFDLGTNVKKWGTLFAVTASVDFVSSSLIPATDNIYSLGSSSREWKDLFIDGTANIDTLSADTASVGRIATSLIPTANDSSFLGTTDFKYKNIHVISSSIDYVSSSLIPHKTSTYDLGSATLQWRSASIKHITASVIIADTITANTVNFTATNTITGSNQFGSGSTNTNSFSGSISAVTHITASGNISASGTITAATFNFGNSTILTNQLTVTSSVWVSGSGQNVYLTNDGTISASSTISSSGTIMGANLLSHGNITASNNISASGTISSTGIIYSAGMITSSVGFSTIGGHLSASDASGSVQIISGGIYIKRFEGDSQDDSDYVVHGRRFTIKNKLQAALPASQSSGIFTVDNYSVNDGDVILGTFMGLTGGGVGTLALSASIHCFTTASIVGGFKFYIHNNKTTEIANDSDFTASFVVL